MKKYPSNRMEESSKKRTEEKQKRKE